MNEYIIEFVELSQLREGRFWPFLADFRDSKKICVTYGMTDRPTDGPTDEFPFGRINKLTDLLERLTNLRM